MYKDECKILNVFAVCNFHKVYLQNIILSCTGFHWWEPLLTSVQCCIDFMVCFNCYYCLVTFCNVTLYVLMRDAICYCTGLMTERDAHKINIVPLSQNSVISYLPYYVTVLLKK